MTHHPVIQSLNELRAIAASLGSLSLPEMLTGTQLSTQVVNGDENINSTLVKIVEALDALCLACTTGGSDNASIAIKNGGVELVTSVCATLKNGGERLLISSLKVLALLLRGMIMLSSSHCDWSLVSHHVLFYQLLDHLFAFADVQSTEQFRRSRGSNTLMEILNEHNHKSNIVEHGFAVVAAAATGNEVIKETFMEMKIDDLLTKLLKRKENRNIQSIYDVICVLVTADDNRVVASQVRNKHF